MVDRHVDDRHVEDIQIGKVAKLLGKTAYRKWRLSGISTTYPLRPGAERLTVETAVDHLELFEVRENAPFRRNSTSELVV